MEKKALLIIIATFNRKDYLKKILQQIQNQSIPSDIIVKTLVVIAGSNDGTIEMLSKDFKEVSVLKGTCDWWWTKCMNEGFKKAQDLSADFILILNDDNEIKSDYLKLLWEDYKTLPNGSILGSASVSIDSSNLINSAGTKEFIRWRLKFVDYIYGFKQVYSEFKGIHTTWTLSGRGTLIPTNTFRKIGFYDDNLVQYGSDEEFIIRARIAGINCFISWNAHVYNHLMLTSEGTAFRKDSLFKFLKSFFNPYSVNSLTKSTYMYIKYGYPLLLPFYLFYLIFGDIKAYLFKY